MKTGALGEITLPGVERSVPVARHCVAELLKAAGHSQIDDALLLVSELVANAVIHSASGHVGGGVTVDVSESGSDLVHIEVIDDGACGVPLPRRAGTDSTGGRGLWLVDQIAAKWGVRRETAGRVAVWAEIITQLKE